MMLVHINFLLLFLYEMRTIVIDDPVAWVSDKAVTVLPHLPFCWHVYKHVLCTGFT